MSLTRIATFYPTIQTDCTTFLPCVLISLYRFLRHLRQPVYPTGQTQRPATSTMALRSHCLSADRYLNFPLSLFPTIDSTFRIHNLSSSLTASHYSQSTAEPTPSVYETSYPSPLLQEFGYNVPQSGEGSHRSDTQVGILLKARAQRNPDGLVRTSSQVSHIERSGSIKSVASINHDNRSYAKRYRSKKRKVTDQVGEMEVVKETSEVGSLRSRSNSSPVYPWDHSLVQLPPPVASLRSPRRQKA
ncbi:hypothetical protein AN958_02340 [Leucoagaricus sp. SymC.cos]|nr:hypothetical protein AN958_02340 [Leucoagaricus sp. SymC.cos]